MVAHQLTPELTQPSVLVEIDHGPPMGLLDGTERRVPGISGSTASAATSPWRRPKPAPMACNVGAEPGVGHCDVTFTEKDNVETRNGVAEYEIVELSEESLTSRRNFGSRDAISSTSTEVEVIAVGPGVNCWGICEKHQQDAPLVSMGVRSGHEDTQPEGTLSPWTLCETAHRVIPPLPDHAKASAELLSIMRSPNDDSPADFSGSAGDTKYRTTHWDRHQAVKSDGNKNVKFVINGKEAAEGGRPIGFEKPEDASHHDLTIRDIHYGGSGKSRSTGQEDAGEVEPLLSMSSASSSPKTSIADTGYIALDTFMWMAAYNLVRYSAPLQLDMGSADSDAR